MMSPSFMASKEPPNAVDAARHICQEARVVLTSLRGGPPNVARGELATDLMDLRSIVKAVLSECFSAGATNNNFTRETSTMQSVDESVPFRRTQAPTKESVAVEITTSATPPNEDEPDGSEQIMDDGLGDGTVFVQPPSPRKSSPQQQSSPQIYQGPSFSSEPPQTWAEDVGPFARPFLAVIVDPRAAGPHTLVALRSLFRLVEQGSLLQPNTKPNQPTHPYTVLFESLTQGVLSCKFEQTDAGADEAVEMAIADLLALLVKHNLQSMRPATLMDAFNTVFVTRNTFVHSPALCYHFEDVLTAIVSAVFSDFHPAAIAILEFLVNQLLHTPLVGGDVIDESMREAQMAHSATRLLCLRLVNCALKTGWSNEHLLAENNNANANENHKSPHRQVSFDATTSEKTTNKNVIPDKEEAELLRIIKDDLCLSLLMTGQAIWTYHDASSNISPGLISLDVLSEICNTLSTLWHIIPLRRHLVAQFETIFTGFYQRALVLLRKRNHPIDSITFNADLVFDAEVEVILESLVDLLCLHDFRHSIADGDGGSLETLFATYDCHMSRSDVAAGLMVELCRCCGGGVNEEGEAIMTPFSSFSSRAGTPAPSEVSLRESSSMVDMSNRKETWRPVPPHLKELCAQALMGAMKCLFRDDKASKETLLQRSQRELTIMLSGEELQHDGSSESAKATHKAEGNNDHFLRNIKSKKRLMRKGARLFNQKASRGIEFLVSAGLFENPPTPASVATFLRNGLVVGLDKHEVGAYLGEAGKRCESGKSPPNWERDWFHKEVLETYCKLFRFEGQSLLDGLRMFLSSFRLPGEAQQIDRILQAFSDTCGAVCEESMAGRLKLFSTDPKRASDGAYLLSFSIIMLNTDLHNQNIREDRKMKLEDFIKNNTNYGSDITDKGKEFPREFLVGIYESIKEEEIRTEGEGADGCMTIERWKDVLRGSTETDEDDSMPTVHDAEDLTELVLEHVWIPIMSAIGAFWGIARSEDAMFDPKAHATHTADGALKGNMLGVQGARLGMDMAVEMLEGVLHLRRLDIFRRIFACVCKYTGLIGEYAATEDERASDFINSLEAQSGLIVAIRVARTACDDIGVDGWKLVWQMMFELRDLKMLGSGGDSADFGRQNILKESEPDLLTHEARRLWNMWLRRGDISTRRRQRESTGFLGAFGRVLFGSDDALQEQESGDEGILAAYSDITSPHGKEALLVWDEDAPLIDGTEQKLNPEGTDGSKARIPRSIGAQFEHDLIQENVMLSQLTAMPVTGLESLEETRSRHLSPRCRVRNRIARSCDFQGLIADSRFMTVEGITCMLRALTEVIQSHSATCSADETAPIQVSSSTAEEVLDLRLPVPPTGNFPLSPASLAFAEVLVCEISLKNKDRLGSLWGGLLETHYKKRLADIGKAVQDKAEARSLMISLGFEKCVTGLLRLSACVTNKSFADDIIGIWSQLIPPPSDLPEFSLIGTLDKQVSAGLWRIINNVDGFNKIGPAGWEGLLALMFWCAARGGQLPPLETNGLTSTSSATLAEDDPALQSYRSLHLMLNTEEVRNAIPYRIVAIFREVICTGERRNCSQLSIAGLDVLQNFLKQRGSKVLGQGVPDDTFWSICWRPSLEAMAYTAEIGVGSNVRQHGLSMLINSSMETVGSAVPVTYFCADMIEVFVPVAGRRIASLRSGEANVESGDELMIEFELSLKLIFKPFRHHIMRVVEANGDVVSLWKGVLSVLEDLLRDEDGRAPPRSPDAHNPMSDKLAKSMNELANEHLQNTIMFLIDEGLIKGEEQKDAGEFSAITWDSVGKMGFCRSFVGGWKEAAAKQAAST